MSTNQNNNIKYALCYIPLVAIIILFIEDNKSEELKEHIKKWLILFWVYFLLTSLIGILFFALAFFVNGLITLFYFILSWILWYKAYKGENVKIEILDDIESKVKDTFK